MPYGYDPEESESTSIFIPAVIIAFIIIVFYFGFKEISKTKPTPPSESNRFVKSVTEREITRDDYRDYCKSKNMIMISARDLSPTCVVGEVLKENNVRQFLIEKEREK